MPYLHKDTDRKKTEDSPRGPARRDRRAPARVREQQVGHDVCSNAGDQIRRPNSDAAFLLLYELAKYVQEEEVAREVVPGRDQKSVDVKENMQQVAFLEARWSCGPEIM